MIAARNAVEHAGGDAARGTARMHKVVAERLDMHPDPDVRAAVSSVADMRRLRNQADYDDEMDAEVALRQQLAFARLVEPVLRRI